MNQVLLIDDDVRLGPLLAEYFERFDIALTCAEDADSGLARLEQSAYDLVILDVMLPDVDGFEACRRIRRRGDVPIIMLTARGDVTDRVVGLELGADDYLAKPFEPRELVARMQNLWRRVQRTDSASGLLDFGKLVIDTTRRRVGVGGQDVRLTTREYELLVLLARHPGRRFTRDEIIAVLRGTDVDIYSRAVDIAVSRLRQKLLPLEPIRTIWGTGYEFVP